MAWNGERLIESTILASSRGASGRNGGLNNPATLWRGKSACSRASSAASVSRESEKKAAAIIRTRMRPGSGAPWRRDNHTGAIPLGQNKSALFRSFLNSALRCASQIRSLRQIGNARNPLFKLVDRVYWRPACGLGPESRSVTSSTTACSISGATCSCPGLPALQKSPPARFAPLLVL